MNKKAYIVLFLCALFLFFKYIAQLFPSLIGFDLIQNYQLNAIQLGIMASSYYYSYSLMQLGAGYLVDKYDLRFPAFCSIFCLSVAILIFAHADDFATMCASRALMGMGASFATILYIKSAALLTSEKAFGIISSFLATATMLGAAVGAAPIAVLFERLGWQNGLTIIALLGVITAFLALFFVSAKKPNMACCKLGINFSDLKAVTKNRQNWLLLVYSGLTFSPVAILGGLWGTPFLVEKFHLSSTNASLLLSVMFLGLALGAPLWALISARLDIKKNLMHAANFIAFSCLIFIVYADFSYLSTLALFFAFGFCVGCFMISFQLCREINSLIVMGFAIAFINTGEGIVGSILEPFIGYLLELTKTGATFTTGNFQSALVVLPVCYVLSSFTLVFIKTQERGVSLGVINRVILNETQKPKFINSPTEPQ